MHCNKLFAYVGSLCFLALILAGCDSSKQTAATPTITESNYGVIKTVKMASATDGATISYTTDDGATWKDYVSPIAIAENKTVNFRAKATKSGFTDSAEATKSVTLNRTISAPEVLPDDQERTNYSSGATFRQPSAIGFKHGMRYIAGTNTTTDDLCMWRDTTCSVIETSRNNGAITQILFSGSYIYAPSLYKINDVTFSSYLQADLGLTPTLITFKPINHSTNKDCNYSAIFSNEKVQIV